MALSKNKKKEVLDKVSKIASESMSLVFVNFHGLPVAETTALRRGLRLQGVGYTVAKKTLMRKALAEGADKKISGTLPELTGEVAIAYSASDMLAPAREVYAFEKKYEGKLSILGSVFENGYISRDQTISIANIPPRQTLLGMLVNIINSPIQRTAIVLSEIAKIKTA
jgi:large subunit ribosomal protein L10